MKDLSNISVVLPSLDPDEKLIAVVDGLLEHGFSDIILVNDGSKQENLHYFEDLAAQHPQIHLLHHEVNRGKGAALKTAFGWFLEHRPDAAGVVTVDGDNQHHPEDTRRCAERMLESGHLVLGVRDFDQEHVPQRSRTGNHITSFVFKVLVGMECSDTQTGLRAIPVAYLPTLHEVYGDRFEYETNMLLALQLHEIPFDEVKIRTVYIEENKSSHFRAVRDSWRIYKLIFAYLFRHRLKRFLKFGASSVICFVADVGLAALSNLLLKSTLSGSALSWACGTCARVPSSALNFVLNRAVVFKSRDPLVKSLLEYYALALVIYLGQNILTDGAYKLFGIGDGQVLLRMFIYGLAMCVMYLLSYTVQKKWIFKDTEKEKA